MAKIEAAQQCAELIDKAGHIVVLTGAGISTAAGIPDFRGPKGLYVTRRYDPETVFDIRYFYRDPKPFFAFARDFVELEKIIQPTFTHQFLSRLEKKGKLQGIITQNIDALHQKAGSQKVFEMHGSIWKSFCIECDKKFSYAEMKDKLEAEDIPLCGCGGVVKPDIVFFGENVKYYAESAELAGKADLFFVIGTSCVVQPAASIPSFVTGKTVVVNKGDISIDMDNIALIVEEDLDDFFRKVSEYTHV